MILPLALLLVLATDPPNDYGATLPSRPPRAATEPAAGVPRDTLTRVPGSLLRLGWTHERTSSIGSFQQQGGDGEATIRQGDLRWFGTTSKATLTYRGDRLAAVRLECTKPTPALLSYVPDELRRAGYRRVSQVIDSGNERSEWSGPATIALTASPASLVADVSVRRAAGAPTVAAAPAPAPAGAPGSATTTGANSAAGNSGVATVTAATNASAADEAPPGALDGEIDFTATRTDSLPVPRLLSTPPPPVRPRIAVDAGLFGRVQVRARVDTTGRVVHAEIARGIAEFNSAALAWVADVRYEPYRVGGRLAPVVVLIPVVFARTDDRKPAP